MSWTIKAATDTEIDAHLATLKKGDKVQTSQELSLDVGTTDAMQVGRGDELTAIENVIIYVPQGTVAIVAEDPTPNTVDLAVQFNDIPFELGDNYYGEWSGTFSFSYEDVLKFRKVDEPINEDYARGGVDRVY